MSTGSLSTASALKQAANLVIGLSMAKMVLADLSVEMRRDLSGLRSLTDRLVHRSPYGAAGTAAVVGVVAGILLAKRRPSRP